MSGPGLCLDFHRFLTLSLNFDERCFVPDLTPVYLPLHASQGNNDKSGGCLLMISRDCFSSLVKAMFKSYIFIVPFAHFWSVFERGLIVIN